MQEVEQIYLLLADGTCFPGRPAGALPRDEFAELVFTTGMSGYVETLTDPSFSGQIILQTFPLIGNYGYCREDMESGKVSCLGYVARHISRHPSNFRSEGPLEDFLKEHNVVGIEGVDTRTITRKIREEGVMNAVITADPSKIDMDALRAFKMEPQVSKVSTVEVLKYPAEGEKKFRVVMPDTGVKKSIISHLRRRGCEVILFPETAEPEAMLAEKPDGIMLGNGPGDPRDYPDLIAKTKVMSDTGLPLMAICLGHQLLALAHGYTSSKMKYGHRGENQGVQEQNTRRIYMTAQNHGYIIDEESVLPSEARILFRNVQDGSCEGIEYLNKPQFSVQFHPEACGGPQETEFLFDRFIAAMEANNATR